MVQRVLGALGDDFVSKSTGTRTKQVAITTVWKDLTVPVFSAQYDCSGLKICRKYVLNYPEGLSEEVREAEHSKRVVAVMTQMANEQRIPIKGTVT
jgi:hypothetical protein